MLEERIVEMEAFLNSIIEENAFKIKKKENTLKKMLEFLLQLLIMLKKMDS